MREIKFRGKRVDNGEWVEGNLLKLETDFFSDSNDTGFMWYIIPTKTNGSYATKVNLLRWINPCYEVDPATVGQFGLVKDDKENEVWEGDILLVKCDPCMEDHIVEVKRDGATLFVEVCGMDYDITALNWALTIWGNYGSWVEVTGNVHDNPELVGRE